MNKLLTYFYKDKPYSILYESKIKLNGVWEDCIIYLCLYHSPDGAVWVRKKEEFFNLFKVK